MSQWKACFSLIAAASLLAGCTSSDSASNPAPQAAQIDAPATTLSQAEPSSTPTAPPTTESELEVLRAEQAAEREREGARAAAVFRSYQQALLDTDPEAAVGLVTDDTLKWYDKSLHLAQTASIEDLEAAPIHQFVTALRLRALLGPKTQTLATGEEAFVALVENGVPHKSRTDGDFRVVAPTPVFQAFVYYGDQPTAWNLRLENENWLVNVQYFNNYLSFLGDDEFALEVLFGARLTRTEFIERLEAATGVAVTRVP